MFINLLIFIQFKVCSLKKVKDGVNINSIMTSKTKLYGSNLEQGDISSVASDYEVTHRFNLAPGNYVIIPSLIEESKNESFLVRIFTDQQLKTV